MKKNIQFMLLTLSLLLLPAFCLAADATPESKTTASNPVDQFTGVYWQKSTDVNKEAYLFGIESAIAVEAVIAERTKDRKKSYRLSPFERGWMEAFKNSTRKEIAKEVDDWYANHPAELNKPVLSVIWYDVIEPRLNAISTK